MSQIDEIQTQLTSLREQQKAQKQQCRSVQRRFDTMYGTALLGMDALYEMASLMQKTYHTAPAEIRAHEIALEFLKDGRFDKIERKFYCLSKLPDPGCVVLLDSNPGKVSADLQRAGNLWGKHTEQWIAIKRAMEIADWKDADYANYGWRWDRDQYRNSDNPFLRWIYRTSTNCETVDFKNSGESKTYRNTRYWLLYV